MFFKILESGGAQIKIKAISNSSSLKFGEILETEEIKLHLTETPENGKANKQLISFLSKKFKVAKSFITIKQGKASSHKIIIIAKITKSLKEFLES